MTLLETNRNNEIYEGKPCFTNEQSITGRKPLSERLNNKGRPIDQGILCDPWFLREV